MAPVKTSVAKLVNENSVSDFLTASDILLKFANNIVNNPNTLKYRRIRLGNPVVESKLLPVSGALECLFEMGFEEDGEFLTLSPTTPLSILTEIRDQLDRERVVVQRSSQTTSAQSTQQARVEAEPSTQQAGVGATAPQALTAGASMQQNNLLAMQAKERQFYQKMESSITLVMTYEDPRLQQQAREVIPLVQLQEEAQQTLDNIQKAESEDNRATDNHKLDIRDCLLLALLNWFKNSFFKWMNSPDCSSCGGSTSNQGMVPPTEEDLRWGGNRVENFRCNTCGQFTKFVRYNHPGKLLQTRIGRCGEWANCFTLCCRALNFEARYVLDWTDHVWTEVYSESQKRWLHCDPCENTCDKPLLYEVGWGKKLTYVIAFSKDDVQDVTWRYSANYSELMKRRSECREKWLVNTVENLVRKRWNMLPEARRNTLVQRKLTELVELLTPKSADGQNLSGRISGSLAWRQARGEVGSQTMKTEPYVFKLTREEVQKRVLHITYNCAKDEYNQLSSNFTTQGFQVFTNKCENIFRKEEHDWRMVYLARTEGSSSAEISWKFDFKESGLKVDRIEVRADSATFENGRINWMLCSETTCALLRGGPSIETVTDLQGETGFSLSAHLSGGKGNVAWQHTQLFRQSADDLTSTPLDIKIWLC